MRNLEDVKSNFSKELGSFETTGTGIREFTEKVLQCLPDYFFAPGTDGRENSIIRHTRSCMCFANALFALEYLRERFQASERDCIRSALMLHDGLLYGDMKTMKPVHEHPEYMNTFLAAQAWDNYLPAFVREDIAKCIRAHSGQWNKQKGADMEMPKPSTDMEFFTHMCVYLASKGECTVKLPVTEEYYRKAFERLKQNSLDAVRIVRQMTDGRNWDGYVHNDGAVPYTVIEGQYVPVAADLMQAFQAVGQERRGKYRPMAGQQPA